MTALAVLLILVSLPAFLLTLDWATSHREHRLDAPRQRQIDAMYDQWRAEDTGVTEC